MEENNEIGTGFVEAVSRIASMIAVVHCENLLIMEMIGGKSAKNMIKQYYKDMQEVVDGTYQGEC